MGRPLSCPELWERLSTSKHSFIANRGLGTHKAPHLVSGERPASRSCEEAGGLPPAPPHLPGDAQGPAHVSEGRGLSFSHFPLSLRVWATSLHHLCNYLHNIINLLKMKMKMISVKETLHHYCEWKQYRFPQTEKICETNDDLESWPGAAKARAQSRCWGAGERTLVPTGLAA